MVKRLKVVAFILQLGLLIWVSKILWEFWSQKGELNIPIVFVAVLIIIVFYIPLLIKQFKVIYPKS